jgi:hypothetical protein
MASPLTTRTGKRYRLKRRHVLGGTAVAMLVIAGGWVMAASFAIQQGGAENGNGTYHGTAGLAFWTESSAGVATQPGPLPAVLSSSAGGPTTLGGSAANYGVNAPTATDVAQFWRFTETAAAPINTELELQFTVSTGVVVTITQVTVYVQTQAAALGGPITFTLYYDLGSPSAGTITLNSVTEISQECPGGTCP